MTKISEVIKYYESIRTQIIRYTSSGDKGVEGIIYILTSIQGVIGDVELSDEQIEAFLCGFASFPFQTPYERKIQKIKLIYELLKDAQMTTKELLTLIHLYQFGPYTLMFEEIKKLISTHGDLRSGLQLMISKAREYGKEEAQKLEYLKGEYSSKFIRSLQGVVKEQCISSDRVLEILPSKEFIDASTTEVSGLGYTISSGEDIVLRRLIFIRVEDEYQKTEPDKLIYLGYSSTGDIVYTSFTKGEYEEDLKSGKKLVRKK